MRFHSYPPRLLILSVSGSISRLVGEIASRAGLDVVRASRLCEVKFFENQRGIVIVMLEVRECSDTFRMVAEVQQEIPHAPLVIITEPDQTGQDRLALRLGARYVIRKPCNAVELDRLFRFILENYSEEGDCWYAMKPKLAQQAATSLFSSSAMTQQRKTGGFLTLEQIKRRAIIAAVSLANGDKMRAARMLGVGKNTVYRAFKESARKRAEAAAGRKASPSMALSIGDQLLSEHSGSEVHRDSAGTDQR